MQEIVLARRFASGDFYGVLDTYWTPLYPILVGIVTYFINSLVLPSVIVSIIAGTLAVPLTYYLVRQSYGRREAVIAAVLAVFFPHLINSFFGLGTENVYLLWIIGALIIGWKGLKRDSAIDYLSTGILLGLAYLTRPEAIGYPIFFVFLVFCKNLRRRKLFARNSLLQIAALLLGFTVLAAPYIFHLRSATGAWTISGKAEINTTASEYLNESAQENNDSAAVAPTSRSQAVKAIIKNIALNLFTIHRDFPYLLPILLLALVALGLFGERWDKERLKREAYLISFCLLTFVGYAAAVVQTRYFYVLLPIFFGWIACGILRLERWLSESIQNLTPNKAAYLFNSKVFVILCIILVYVYVFPINFFVRSEDKAWKTVAFEERNAGLWLKENGKPSPLVFSVSFRPIFYAEGKSLSPKTKDIGEILAQIKERKVDYVVTSERSLKRHSYLDGFPENLPSASDFELIYEKTERDGYKISIFRVK